MFPSHSAPLPSYCSPPTARSLAAHCTPGRVLHRNYHLQGHDARKGIPSGGCGVKPPARHSSPCKKRPRRVPSPPPLCEHTDGKTPPMKVFIIHQICGCPDTGCPASRTRRTKRPLLMSHPLCGVCNSSLERLGHLPRAQLPSFPKPISGG